MVRMTSTQDRNVLKPLVQEWQPVVQALISVNTQTRQTKSSRNYNNEPRGIFKLIEC